MNTVDVIQPTITKTHPEMTTGISVKYVCNIKALVISRVASRSPFYGILPKGYHLIAVNEDYSITTVEDAIAAIKTCQSTVKITAVSIPVQAGLCRLTNLKKASPTDVRFDSTQTNLVRVANISNIPGSFSSSPIEQGDIILSIENKVVSNPAVAAHLLQDIQGTGAVLFVPVSRLQKRAIYGSSTRIKGNVKDNGRITGFTPIVHNKTYTLNLACFPGFHLKVEFVDFYTFRFEEVWWQTKARGDARRLLALTPLVSIFNETMIDILCRLDNIVGFYSSSQGAPNLTISSSLKELADLKSRNLLTDEEFRAAKAKILGLGDDVIPLPQVYALPAQEATVVGIVVEEEEESQQ